MSEMEALCGDGAWLFEDVGDGLSGMTGKLDSVAAYWVVMDFAEVMTAVTVTDADGGIWSYVVGVFFGARQDPRRDLPLALVVAADSHRGVAWYGFTWQPWPVLKGMVKNGTPLPVAPLGGREGAV